eukprot:scaffold1147_cov172-Amphora_coffeaeformis.AAC.17
MGVENAWNPILVAFVASIAMGLHVYTGFVSCDFVQVTANEDEVLAITETSAQKVANQTSMGLICDGDFYDLDGDDMRMYSHLFYYVATGAGGLCVFLAWAISTCCTPTMTVWRVVALLSSISALASLPTFLILETYPCEDFEEQSCSLSWDSYCLMAAVGLFILVTALTQFLDPPDWVSQLHHWRVPKGRSMDTERWSSGEDEDGSQNPILTPRLEPPKNRLSWCRGRKKSSSKDRVERGASRPILSYALPPTDIEQGDSLVEEEVVSTPESERLPEKSENWTPFEPNTNLFREKHPVDFTSDVDENLEANQAQSYPTVAPHDDELEPPSLSPQQRARQPETGIQQFNPKTPSTPPVPHYRVEQVPISPLTHYTSGSAPASPSIDRSMVQDPIFKHSSRVSTPNRSLGEEVPALFNETEMTTPVKRMQWSHEESILDGIVNGDDSLLDKSYDRTVGSGVPFIPTVEESRKMATQGYSVYADLQQKGEMRATEESPPQYDIDKLVNRSEIDSFLDDSHLASEAVYADLEREAEQHTSQENEPPQYDIDELVNGRANETSLDDSLLDSEDIRAIAVEGTPIYASLLLDHGDKITKQIGKAPESVQSRMNIKKSLSAEEYLLQKSLSGDGKLDSSKREETHDAKGDKPAWNFVAPLRQNNRGYDKLADLFGSDEELEDPEEPPMTEVSFNPSEVQEVSLDKDEVHQPKNKMEKDLLDDWNKMFDTHGPIPVKTQGIESGDIDEEEDRRDEEELLRLISSEDFSDDSPKSTGDQNDQAEEAQSDSPSSSPDKPPRSGGKNTLRPKRRARRSRSRASGSVGSSPSLLDVTIEEETQSDLEDFNKDEERGRSLNKSGTKAYGPNEVHRVTAGVQEILKRSRSRSVDLHTKSAGDLVPSSLSYSAARMSTWRSERESRASIHDPVVVSDEEKETAGKTANDLRQSRIQRLQTPEISAIARARMRRDRFFGEMNHPHSTSYKSAHIEQIQKKPEEQKATTTATWTKASHRTTDPPAYAPSANTPVHISSAAAGDDGSQTTTPDGGIGEVGSFLLGSLSMELGDLDASLAALSRPDGSEYGPDEHSI